jgi:hypothetical protein
MEQREVVQEEVAQSPNTRNTSLASDSRPRNPNRQNQGNRRPDGNRGPNPTAERLSKVEREMRQQGLAFESLKNTVLKASTENSKAVEAVLEILKDWELVVDGKTVSKDRAVEHEETIIQENESGSSMQNEEAVVAKPARKELSPMLKWGLGAVSTILLMGGSFYAGRVVERKSQVQTPTPAAITGTGKK